MLFFQKRENWKYEKDKRSVSSILVGIWRRCLTIIIPFTFPAHITTFLHKLRGVKIGKGTKINRTAIIDDANADLVEIGKNVWITAGVMILCHQRDLKYYEIGKAVMDCPLKRAKVVIEDGAHIGIGAIVLPGVTIGKGAVVGAGAVVVKNVPAYSVVIGVPAKVIKTFE
jgi:acetyltransferase-like isoleucine patch superfamily enzyme